MLAIFGLRLSESVREVWKFRHRIRGRADGIGEPEKIHLAGRETLITADEVEYPPAHLPKANSFSSISSTPTWHFSIRRLSLKSRDIYLFAERVLAYSSFPYKFISHLIGLES